MATESPVRVSCVLSDLGEGETEEICGPRGTQWQLDRMDRVLFDSPAIVAAAVPDPEWIPGPGLYFLVWHGKVCYVGQGQSVGMRLVAHQREGRPHDAVAVIAGIPSWALDEFEHAYIRAWDPPWNNESKRCGHLHAMPALTAAAKALDKSAVMPWYVPTVQYAIGKKWQLAVLGYRQAHAVAPSETPPA